MKVFLLKTKDGETINRVNALDVEDATEMFASIKNLKVDVLISIYEIEEMTK
ncbi:MAG: hypothetical protein KDC82_04245 [Bacteroidetes bacterium]|nr:hypothetical protein [Bacteroidota bacterium]